MDHSPEVDGGAGSLGFHGTDACPLGEGEFEFDEGDWEEGEEQHEEYDEETQGGEETDEEEGEVEKELSPSDSSGGDEEVEEREQGGEEASDYTENSIPAADVKTGSPVVAATGRSGTFAAASPFAALSESRGSGVSDRSVFGALAASTTAPPPPQQLIAPSALASPLATAPPLQTSGAKTTPSFPSSTMLPSQHRLGTTAAPLHFVDFERSLAQKLPGSEWRRARSKAEEAQDVRCTLARYELVLPTDAFDEQINKALYVD
ncbi:hypothetical protein LSCM1_00968 [Leishmania martiniquensis]|uniref:Uncharacterized protein n=1 Tax=Leishmania martiniquensis TaxID=1580590 RepID=A0A836KAU9_9TRYP|nr:hypothetical protein LSCM1_00968 [Leishmania martiniquensis]